MDITYLHRSIIMTFCVLCLPVYMCVCVHSCDAYEGKGLKLAGCQWFSTIIFIFLIFFNDLFIFILYALV